MSSRSRTLKTRTFQNLALLKNSIFKISYFQNLVLFSEMTYFQNLALLKNSIFKISYFQNRVLSKLVPFTEFRAFFKTSVFLKIPRSKFVWNSPQKFRVFFKNSPFRKKLTLQIPCFFQKIPCFTKFPGFQIF